LEAKKLKLSGYSCRRDNRWEFSQKATDIVKEDIAKFRLWFMAIRGNQWGDLSSNNDLCNSSESWGKVDEIQDRSKSILSRSSEKVPFEAQQLDGGAVRGRLSQLRINNWEN